MSDTIPKLVARRVRAQVELLAASADAPQMAGAILREVGIDQRHFSEHDTLAIYLAIGWASNRFGPSRSKIDIATLARVLLRSVHHWHDDNFTPAICGCNWGPGPLAVLLHRIPFNADTVREKALELLNLHQTAITYSRAWRESRGRQCA